MFLEYRFYYCTINYKRNSVCILVCWLKSFPALHSGIFMKTSSCFVVTYSTFLPPPYSSTFLTPFAQRSTWLPAPPSLSGCRARRWRRCPCGWTERPFPSCSPGQSLPRCGRPAAPPSAPRPGAGCSAPPCPPGHRSAGRSLQTAGERTERQEERVRYG